MPFAKDKKSKMLLKVEVSSGSDSDGSEHELSYYAKDKVKLMKEVLKLIKPKKIKSMAPDCIKDLDIVEINSMLLEELLGISNKRLQYIFNGENVDRETSSSESEEEKQPVDVISLDDISDDDDIELCISLNERESLEPNLSKKNKHKSHNIKTETVDTTVKLEKPEKSKKDKKKCKKTSESKSQDESLKETDKDKLMSVLELLELQARARAIRSQLAIETDKKKANESPKNSNMKREEGSDSDAIIIESPQYKEIVITSSDSEEESNGKRTQAEKSNSTSQSLKHLQKIDYDSAPPQKKQKSHAQEQSISNKSEQQNKDANIQLVIGDRMVTQKNREIAETDDKKRKEKLFAKIQKIKLIRNRATTSNQLINTEIINVNEQDRPEDNSNSNEGTVETATKISETPSALKEVNQEDLLMNISKDSEVQLQNSKNTLELPNNLPEEKQNVDVNEDDRTGNSPKLKEMVPADSHKKTNVSYCDNDEIVINLDEDEMDGIENE